MTGSASQQSAGGGAGPGPAAAPGPTLEASIGRLLTYGTYASIGLIAVGVALMAVGGRSPFDDAPAFDPGAILGDVVGLRPAGFLWLGLVVMIATPAARVIAAAIGYARRGERGMTIVGVVVIIVIAIGVAAGLLSGGRGAG